MEEISHLTLKVIDGIGKLYTGIYILGVQVIIQLSFS